MRRRGTLSCPHCGGVFPPLAFPTPWHARARIQELIHAHVYRRTCST